MRLIDADKLLENIGNSYLTKAERRLFSIKIRHAPTVEESKQGSWNYIQAGMAVCPFCGGTRRDNRIDHINFCNRCGADMREVKKNVQIYE